MVVIDRPSRLSLCIFTTVSGSTGGRCVRLPSALARSMPAFTRSLMSELWQDAPKVLIVMSNDVFPWVSGNTRDSRTELAGFTDLRAFLSEGYVMAREIGDFAIFVQRPDVAHPAGALDRVSASDGSARRSRHTSNRALLSTGS